MQIHLSCLHTHYFSSSNTVSTDTLVTHFSLIFWQDEFWRKYLFVIMAISLLDLLLDLQLDWVSLYIHSTHYKPHFQLLRLFFMLRDFRMILILQKFTGL